MVNKIQCEWGSNVGTDQDPYVCTETAVGIVAVKDGPRVHRLSVCSRHRLVLVSETAPARR